jgi:two-component system sensor histidine kinase/response regulator
MDNFEEIREMLDMMAVALKKVDEFIKNTHEYYKLKRGMLEFEEISFKKIISDTEDLFKIAGRMENVRFTSTVSDKDLFWSDELSIKIILNNLLSNAFNYQRKDIDDKFVSLDIAVSDEQTIITVKDNGIGIHESHINNIFGMFYRATSEETGSGLGLYNVKDALSKLNGEIEVDSKVNQGTTFKVTIPGKAHGSN